MVEEDISYALLSDPDHLKRKYYDLWRRNVKVGGSSADDPVDKSWLSAILFNPASQNSIQITADIVERIVSVPSRRLLMADHLTQLLNKVCFSRC